MKKITSILFALLLVVKPIIAADFTTCTCTITNAPTVHGNTITVKGSQRDWTNSVVTPASQILTNSTIGGSATNLFNHFGTFRVAGVTVERSGTNAVKFHGFDVSASVSAGWATMTCVTNVSTNVWIVSVPFSPMVSTNRTIVGSQLVLDLSQYSTNAFNQNSNVTSELVGTTNTQTLSGIKTWTGASTHSNSAQQWIGGTNSFTVGLLTNGLSTNMILHSPTTTNLINYDNAISSRGFVSTAEQFGQGALATNTSSLAVGRTAKSYGVQSTAIGYFSQIPAGADYSVAIGSESYAAGLSSTALGTIAEARAPQSVALGASAFVAATHTNSIALGTGATTTTQNQAVIGSTSVNYIYLFGRVFSTVGYTNSTMIGTNVVTAGISFTRLNNTSLADGNNAAVDIGGTEGGSRTYVRVSGPSAAFNINGIAGGWDGRWLIIQNHSGQSMTIMNDSGVDPVAANRIYTGIGGNVTITNSPGVACFIYDSAQARWIYDNQAGTSIAGVTSVALALPTSVFDISGSPVTSSGTLTATFDNQSANTVFAGPTTGSATTPAFRALVADDVPSHERFQFDNRATTTVSAGTDTTLTNATASGTVTIPANYLTTGTVIEVEAFGATVGMASGQTMTNKFKLSGNTIVTGLIDVEGDAVWFWKSTTTIRTTGVSGTFLSGGFITHENLSTSRYPRGSGSIDTTAAQTIDFTSAIQGFAAESVICSNLVVKITRP